MNANRRPEEESAMSPKQYHDAAVKLPAVSIDMKVPLWGLMSLAGVAATIAATMYFTMIRVADDVVELKAAFKASNAQTMQFVQEQALLRFRIEKLETERKNHEAR